MSDKKHRVGIFGGTFHPIHYGHLIIAENACEQFDLEKVIFMPTGHAPHKEYAGSGMDKHRCRMVELAIADNPLFEISYREVISSSINYTYQTLHRLNEEFPDTAFYFILGADSLFDFHLWRHPELICKEAVILAAVRDDLNESRVDAQIESLTTQLQAEIHRLNTPNFNVSSKIIRERIRNSQTIRYLTPDPVAQYIVRNRLYDYTDTKIKQMKYKEIQNELKRTLKKDRYQHTIGVVKTAVELAEIYGCSRKKAKYAALLHDCAKYLSDEEKIKMCRKDNIPISPAEMSNPSLLHAKCGVIIAKDTYGIEDSDILHAIMVHTTGVPDMSLLDQIVFTADYIEPGRDRAPHLKELRKLARTDLSQAVYQILEDTVSYLRTHNAEEMDPTTVAAYEFYKENYSSGRI